MNDFFLIIYIWVAFLAMAFWESSVEGRNAWHKNKLGWKTKVFGIYFTRYHLNVNLMIIVLMSLPLIFYGWNLRVFGILLTGYFSGMVIEDFFWYVTNPVVKVKELNTKFANYYPRIKFSKIYVPTFYFIGLILAVLSWLIFVK